MQRASTEDRGVLRGLQVTMLQEVIFCMLAYKGGNHAQHVISDMNE
jgi:hypothetical protein